MASPLKKSPAREVTDTAQEEARRAARELLATPTMGQDLTPTLFPGAPRSYRGKAVDTKDDKLVFEFPELEGNPRILVDWKDPKVVSAMRTRRLETVDAATFPFTGLIVPFTVDFREDEIEKLRLTTEEKVPAR